MNERTLWVLVVLVLFGDVLTSWYAIDVLGMHEGNPVVWGMISIVGLVPGLVLSKLLVLGAGAMLRQRTERPKHIPAAIVGVYSIVVVRNLVTIGFV